jgi:hypothetical protein
MRFSVNHSARSLFARAHEVLRDKEEEVDHQLQAVELIKATRDRQQFYLHAVFPKEGLFRVELFVDTHR